MDIVGNISRFVFKDSNLVLKVNVRFIYWCVWFLKGK